MREPISLFIEVPICAFRPNWSREYQDTYGFPPPATVFGMLLSLVGIDWPDKRRFAGVRLALALQGEPERARVFRKFRRVPQANKKADPLTSRRPDYQDLLLWVRLWVWLDDGEAESSLCDRVKQALDPMQRGSLYRWGGLSLGESSHLVDSVSISTPGGEPAEHLVPDPCGPLSLPVWVQHPRDATGKTRMGRFRLGVRPAVSLTEDSDLWTVISP